MRIALAADELTGVANIDRVGEIERARPVLGSQLHA
jgi:hypothetical protein